MARVCIAVFLVSLFASCSYGYAGYDAAYGGDVPTISHVPAWTQSFPHKEFFVEVAETSEKGDELELLFMFQKDSGCSDFWVEGTVRVPSHKIDSGIISLPMHTVLWK